LGEKTYVMLLSLVAKLFEPILDVVHERTDAAHAGDVVFHADVLDDVVQQLLAAVVVIDRVSLILVVEEGKDTFSLGPVCSAI